MTAKRSPSCPCRHEVGAALTTRGVANRLGVSTNFVVEEIRSGRLKGLSSARPSGPRR